MKKLLALTAALLLLLCGCGQTEEPTSKLWVVTERTEWNGMNGQAKQMIELFEEKHPEFTVELDVLPQGKAEREVRLKQIRSQIMSGKGPDVFLLPTDTTSLMPIDYEQPTDRIGPPPPTWQMCTSVLCRAIPILSIHHCIKFLWSWSLCSKMWSRSCATASLQT